MTKTKLVLMLFFLQGLMACSAAFDVNNSMLKTECTEGVATDGTTCLVKSSSYVYTTAFGGRSNMPAYAGPNAQLSFTIPTGWYDGSTAISPSDSNWSSVNLKSGFSILGIGGDLTGGTYAACAANSLNASSCTASVGTYVYDSAYGGRATDCGIAGGSPDTTISSSCWLAVSGKYIYSSGGLSDCPATEGAIAVNCAVPVGQYWYNSSYGGRSLNCTMGQANASPCWVNQGGVDLAGTTCSAGLNNTSCITNANEYVYSTEYGGRNINCSTDNAGSCWFDQTNKSDSEPKLIAANIRQGSTIFGVTGNFTGIVVNWMDAMFRTKGSAAIKFTDETTTYAGNTALPANYHPIPKIATDNDGYVVGAQVTLVDRSTWAATTCGTAQATVALRITNCATVFGANATWDGSIKANAGQSVWKLVTRSGALSSGKGREVWQDQATGLLWSSLVSNGVVDGLNWCKASGANNNTNTGLYKETDPSGICDNSLYQDNSGATAISACVEASGFTTTDASIDDLGKGGLNNAAAPSTPKVAWRLPTMYDYMVANHNGIRFVLPDIGPTGNGLEWTATLNSSDKSQAWTFDSNTGSRNKTSRNYLQSVRCIGR
jgi:hypothetical protein